MKRIFTSPRQIRVLALLAAAALAVGLLALVATVEPAEAAFPGQNGKIAFESTFRPGDSSTEIYVMNADGTAPTRLTNNQTADVAPASHRMEAGSPSLALIKTLAVPTFG
jgi:hypothetical protein